MVEEHLFDLEEETGTAGTAPQAPDAEEPRLPGELVGAIARTFGIDRLRPMQARAMDAALRRRDLLLVLPTGGGKSLCYQAPALVRDGLTVVVSPLIALMKDQVDGLVQNGVPAAMLASTQDVYERREVFEELERGRLKLLFVAPERLMLDGFLRRLVELGLSAVAVDEAHCISHWGHDFRPEYRRLGELKQMVPDVPVHAFTATATAQVRREIASELQLVDPVVLVGPCDRPNLTYRAQPRRDLLRQLLDVVDRHKGEAGIVYCISRRETEELDAKLRAAGVKSAAYHAGLSSDVRRRVQESFQAEEVDVVTATVAFGMGIDRTDVRFVAHAGLPKGIEQYSQETGRAGRDGLAAECVLFFSGSDFYTWKSLMERGHAEASANGGDVERDVLDASLARLSQMMGYTTRFTCRHRQLVEHFGQKFESPPEGCGACDVCLGEIEAVADAQVVAQKILSCVVRCEQRYGGGHIADVLRGADTARIRQTGHDRLSTYGLLKEHSTAEVRGWIDQLVGLDHLRVEGDRYPTLYLSDSGVAVMKAEQPVTLFAVPKSKRTGRRRAAVTAAEDGLPVDQALFEALRALRRELARERAIPPYLIFSDRTLAELAARKPRSESELLAVKGVGEKKAADLGPTFLAAIESHEGAGEQPAE
ncbi:MAG: DNA helicase RecQ [Planctomycetota bacterium]